MESDDLLVFKVDGKEFKIDVSRLRTTVDSIDSDLTKQAEEYGYVGRAAGLARAYRETAEDALETLRAELDSEIRLRFEKSNTKVTEEKVKNSILSDGRVMLAKGRIASLRESEYQLEALARAFDKKGNNLVALAANLRAEMSQRESV